MSKPKSTLADEQIIETMIELSRCSKLHRIIVSGPNGPDRMFELYRHGFNRVATTSTCGLPQHQYDAAFVEWHQYPIKTLATTLNWLEHFLSASSVLVIRINALDRAEHRKLAPLLEKIGFRVEAGTRCPRGIVVSARRRDASHQAIAA
jgi:hypothetical protein